MIMTFRNILLLVVALVGFPVWAGAAYDFAYVVQGDPEVTPIQVFDDGAKTYFQLKGSFVPVFVARDGKEEQLLDAQRAGQLLAVPALASAFNVRYGNLVATVRYIGAPRAGRLPEATPLQAAGTSWGADTAPVVAPPTAYGPVQPIKGPSEAVNFQDRETLVPFARGKTVLTKEAARLIQLGLMGPGTVERVVILGRDDAAYVEGTARVRGHAIRDRVIAAGVSGDKVVVKEMAARDGDSQSVHSDMVVTWSVRSQQVARAPTSSEAAARKPGESAPRAHGAPAAPLLKVWSVRKTDETVERMLTRWAAEAGWKVVWRGAPTIAITGDLSFEGADFLQAVEHVITQSQAGGYAAQLVTARPR